jgi:alpha-1,3-mannosyltransferase
MKILHITPTLYPVVGGMETVIRELMLQLRGQGIVADAMHLAPGNRTGRETLDQSTVWRFPLFPNRLIGVAPPIRSILLEYDLLHVHDAHGMAVSFNALLQGRGRKKLLSTHGGYFHTSQHSLIKTLHWRFIAQHVLASFDEVLASSSSDFEIYKTKAPHVKLVPNGVNVDKFFSVEHAGHIDPTRWLYWGRLAKNKRLDLLIDTVAQARDAGILIDLLIAGPDFDVLAPDLQTRIKALSLSSQVKLVGALSESELLAEMANRSVYATATEHEGFGLTLIEAMAGGLLVLCRDMPPLNGFVQDFVDGAFLKFDQSHSDLSTIRRLCHSSPEELLRMRQSARQSSHSHSWDSVVTQYVKIYENLMTQAGTSCL